MSERSTVIVVPFRPDEEIWCAKRVTEHWDQSRTSEVLYTAPTRREVADWLEQQRTERTAR